MDPMSDATGGQLLSFLLNTHDDQFAHHMRLSDELELAQGGRSEVVQAHRRLCELAENTAPRCKPIGPPPDR